MTRKCILLGAPVQAGAGQAGCEMGPGAYRSAGLREALTDLGLAVEDWGDVVPAPPRAISHPNRAVRLLPDFEAWTRALGVAAFEAGGAGIPIFLGGDHSLSAGTIAGTARRAASEARELFVLWLDAHPDFHTLDTTESGNLHGTPLAYVTGRHGFAPFLPLPDVPVKPENVCIVGLRSVDPADRIALGEAGVAVHDIATGYPPLLAEMTILTALRTAATSAAAAKYLVPRGARAHPARRSRQPILFPRLPGRVATARYPDLDVRQGKLLR